MKKYYAHSIEGDLNRENWQELEKHLEAVAEMASGFADKFSSKDWGEIAGLWHDLGKYQEAFQRKLDGEKVGVEHSGAGAAQAVKVDKYLGTFLAFAIAGHHTGLANLIKSEQGAPTPLKERLRENKIILEQILDCVPPDILKHATPKYVSDILSDETSSRGTLKRRCDLWVRFLLSALVDADRLDTERFTNAERAERRGEYSSIHDLTDRLHDFIHGKMSALTKEEKENPLNQARANILYACRRMAERELGLFSLTVPTGGGKTLSSMSFALNHAALNELERVIVVIPYTSIIEQNAKEYRNALGAEDVLEHHSNLDPITSEKEYGKAIVAKHELAAENWDAPVIVTTTVQFFESLFSNHPSRCRKLHNMAKSVIILDEVQSLPCGFLLTILDALKELTTTYGSTVVLSTATPPALMKRNSLPQGLENIVPIIEDPLFLSRSLERVRYSWPDLQTPPVEWPELAEELSQYEQVLTVVHKRRDARELCQLVQEKADKDSVFHLSALMCPAHRSEVLDKVKNRLEEGLPCRLISTQLIEAGVDIDFPVVYRALAGLDSIVQAAGRCNREAKPEKGTVVVFEAPSSPPPGTLRKGMEKTKSLLEKNSGEIDTGDPAIFEEYFRMLYSSETLDKASIQAERAGYNFATVNKLFKIIEDGFTETIIVPHGDWEERVNAVLDDPSDRQARRALQPFTVSIYNYSFDKLDKNCVVEERLEGLYTITEPYEKTAYSELFGLVEGDEVQINPEALIK